MKIQKHGYHVALKEAQSLAEKKDRSKEENDKIAKYVQSSREQLEMAELLGYGNRKDYKPMYEQLDEIALDADVRRHHLCVRQLGGWCEE